MDRNEIINLLKRYNSGNCSDEEKAIIESWYLQYRDNSAASLTEEERLDDLQSVFDALPLPQNARRYRVLPLYKIAAAVAAVFIVVLGIYFYRSQQTDTRLAQVIETKIVPGGTKATLTLSDGSRIILDDAETGVLASQSGVSIQKTADGQLIYSVSNSTAPAAQSGNELMYNTIETPVGGSYQINLPDGTKVWLNAASSLSFPTKFSDGSRVVKLTGEAYFEVAKNKHMPFSVKFNKQVVEVLGTQFNINSYTDEGADKTTLFEGSVRLSQGSKQVVLKPGQQAVYEKDEMKVKDTDLEEALAWKNGYFMFKNENIKSIMRKIARWYDVEVSYSGNIPDIGFGGTISRSTDITEVLNALQLTNSIHFKIEGRRITVMP
ncbi:MAG: FecR family protein [Daejeonella sp.]|uniref:FecR family protein n=1 Tax=Daejeonella sp. JGW-45 TaxID=3034148 RepID=UPI0023ED9F76|nr:FecR family protein [Daejeonella sp. JGW-45]